MLSLELSRPNEVAQNHVRGIKNWEKNIMGTLVTNLPELLNYSGWLT